MTEISGPCAPSLIPPPKKAITEERWRRLPFNRISVLSAGKPRRLAGLTRDAASLIGFW